MFGTTVSCPQVGWSVVDVWQLTNEKFAWVEPFTKKAGLKGSVCIWRCYRLDFGNRRIQRNAVLDLGIEECPPLLLSCLAYLNSFWNFSRETKRELVNVALTWHREMPFPIIKLFILINYSGNSLSSQKYTLQEFSIRYPLKVWKFGWTNYTSAPKQ